MEELGEEKKDIGKLWKLLRNDESYLNRLVFHGLMEDSSQFYHVPEVPASWNFELVGHAEKTLGDDPIFGMLDIDTDLSNCQYPDWVVPMGNLPDGEKEIIRKFQLPEGTELLAAVRLQPEGIVRANYYLDSPTVVRYDDKLKERLSGYDYRRHRLFAFSREEVLYHEDNKTEELDMIKRVLSDERFNDTNPYLRLSIASRSKDHGLVLSELRKCVKHIGVGDYLRVWYQAQIDCMKIPEDQLGDGMPELARTLERPGMLESLLVDN